MDFWGKWPRCAEAVVKHWTSKLLDYFSLKHTWLPSVVQKAKSKQKMHPPQKNNHVVSDIYCSWSHDYYYLLLPGDVQGYLLKNKKCIYSCIIAFSLTVTRDKKEFTFWFNNEAYHSPSLSLSVLDNIIFMSLSGPDATITVSNKPQPQRVTENKYKETYVCFFSLGFVKLILFFLSHRVCNEVLLLAINIIIIPLCVLYVFFL